MATFLRLSRDGDPVLVNLDHISHIWPTARVDGKGSSTVIELPNQTIVVDEPMTVVQTAIVAATGQLPVDWRRNQAGATE